jgi:hypothetical protein
MTHPSEQRRSPRAEMVGKMFGRLAAIDRQLVVRDISLGGMSIETPVALETGAVLQFVLTLGDGAGVDVSGRIVRCVEVAGPEGAAFVSGVEFVDVEPEANQVPDLMGRIDTPRG